MSEELKDIKYEIRVLRERFEISNEQNESTKLLVRTMLENCEIWIKRIEECVKAIRNYLGVVQ